MKKIIIIISVVLFAITINAQVNYNNNTTNGSYSSALGENNSADGPASFVGGINSSADGGYSFAFGNTAQSLSPHSVALGAMTTANGSSSFALGKFCKADGASAFVIGSGQSSSNIFTNSTHHSLMVGFNSDKPTFFIGGSIGLGYTGKIGIGDVIDPHAKLHIKADNNEYVDLLLEPGGSGNFAKIKFGEISLNNSPNRIEAKQDGDLDFYTASDYVFRDGNVGIGLTNPSEKLEVDGTVKSTGLMLNNGTQAAGKILQSDATGLASWVDPLTLNVDDGDWAVNGDGVCNINDNIGIGTTGPDCLLHINSYNGSNNDLTFFKISNEGVSAGGTTTIGRIGGNGPSIVQQAGDMTFGNGKYPSLSFIQKSFNEDRGLSITTYLKEDGSVDYPTIFAENSKLAIMSTEYIVFGMGVDKAENIYFEANGNVGIGISGPEEKLEVAGNLKVYAKIEANEIEVMEMKQWEDKVFEESYNLASLSEVEGFIKENGHLPEIPSEANVLENGYNMGEMDAMLLKKIEELTLYVIEQQKEIDELKKKR